MNIKKAFMDLLISCCSYFCVFFFYHFTALKSNGMKESEHEKSEREKNRKILNFNKKKYKEIKHHTLFYFIFGWKANGK